MNVKKELKASVKAGMKKGWFGFLWVLKILIPISFCTFLLEYSGLLGYLDGVLEPIMGIFQLPAVAALPIIIGLLTGIYGAVAAMTALPLSTDHMTLIAIFLLISHNLFQEGIIQEKSGSGLLKATLIRLAASVIAVMITARVMDVQGSQIVVANTQNVLSSGFSVVLMSWFSKMAVLSIKICLIITALMVVLEIMKTFNIIDFIVKLIQPLLYIMGLDRKTGILWLTAAVFGLTYGGAVIVEETKTNPMEKEKLDKLHVSIGINHSLIEDPALFLPLGIGAFWLWIPRFAAAVIATHLYGLLAQLKGRKKVSIPAEP